MSDHLQPKDQLNKDQLGPQPAKSPRQKSRGKEQSPEQKIQLERLQSAKKVKAAQRTAEWQSAYLAILNSNDKQNYTVLISKNKKLKEELKAIVAATEQVIIKEKYVFIH